MYFVGCDNLKQFADRIREVLYLKSDSVFFMIANSEGIIASEPTPPGKYFIPDRELQGVCFEARYKEKELSQGHIPKEIKSSPSAELQTVLERCEAQIDLGAGTTKDKKVTEDNKVPWNINDDNFYPNKEAIKEANKAGQDYDIYELKSLDYGKLKKLLRKHDCTIRFMSRKSPPPPRGRVHKKNWKAHIKKQIDQAQNIENAIEKGVINRTKHF